MLCTGSCAELTNTPMILRYQRIELERQRCCMAPASGRGAQRSACIKTRSVCFTRRINVFFFEASGVLSNILRRYSRNFPLCRVSCVLDRPAVEGLYASRMLRKQVTRRSSVQYANRNGQPRPLSNCSSVTLATIFRFRDLHVFERKATCLFVHTLAAVEAQPSRKDTNSFATKRHASGTAPSSIGIINLRTSAPLVGAYSKEGLAVCV